MTLGAFRSVRRESDDPAESLLAMHKVLLELADERATSTATIGHWNAPASTFRWVTAGDESPGPRHRQTASSNPSRASCIPPWEPPASRTSSTPTRSGLTRSERLLLLSDSFTDPRYGLGLPAIERAVAKADGNAAPATLRAIEDILREAHPDNLDDDATIIVLAPSGMIGAVG